MTLQHHTARPFRTSTSRTMTSPWTPAMAQTAAANSPAPFQQMVKLRADTIRQGLLPPTAIDGSHPNESYGDNLAREILYITHTGLLQDFNNWKSIHRPQPPTTKEELDHTLQRYFDDDTSNHLSMTSRTNFAKYMLDFYDVANTYTAQKLQCQYCKKRFAKHFLMPMYPKLLHRTDANTYLFCWGCLQAANGRDHMIHPGPWLNTTKESEDANMTPILDLSLVSNRPWALQSLDEDFDADFVPFVWIPSVDDQAQAYHEATFSHFWDNQQNRWRRTSLTCIDTQGQFYTPDANQFQNLTGRIWKNRSGKNGDHHQFYSKSETYAQALRQIQLQFPDLPTKEARIRVLQTLKFISEHATASFFHLKEDQRNDVLRTFVQWETSRINASLRGIDSDLHHFLHSDKNDLFLKQFWTVVLPSLHHHFICRNPNCKKVVLSHHWATNVKPGKRTQGHYLCPACLTYYRPWAMQDHRGNPLLRPKQCLVVKTKCPPQDLTGLTAQSLVHTDRPDIHYYLYLMEWPEDATDDLLQTLKLQTADLFQAYDQAEDKIAFLHDKIRTQLQEAQPLPYMKRAFWSQDHIAELEARNHQAGAEIYAINLLPKAGPAHDKRPFYDWCAYEYEEGVTHVLKPEQVTKLMALTCCRLLVSTFANDNLLGSKQTTKRQRSGWTTIEHIAYRPEWPRLDPRWRCQRHWTDAFSFTVHFFCVQRTMLSLSWSQVERSIPSHHTQMAESRLNPGDDSSFPCHCFLTTNDFAKLVNNLSFS